MAKSAFYRFTVLGAVIMALLFGRNRLVAGAPGIPEETEATPAYAQARTIPEELQVKPAYPQTQTIPEVTKSEPETQPQSSTETAEAQRKPETELEAEPERKAEETGKLLLSSGQIFREAEEETVFVYDIAGGRMLYCSGSETGEVYPASITKLFTAYTALRLLPEDTVVTAGWELGLLKPGSSYAGIGMDSRLTVRTLVEAMLLPSGNDAAYVLAAAAGRSAAGDKTLGASAAVAAFMAYMNETARELGFAHSHFVNPDGYHDAAHYSCPEDLARIGELALADPVIAEFASKTRDTVRFASGESVTWDNTNRLINPASELYCPEAVGLKTGYTNRAGFCLLSAFRRGDRQILVGIFGGRDKLSRYSDAAALWQAAMDIMDQEACG